ncbi:membrane protein [Deltaproteobacteria bacterium]|nr:membrane protein [Deltaproteobacteria bacterium]
MQQLDPRVVTLWRLQGVVSVFTSWVPIYLGLGWFLAGRFGFVVTVAALGTLFALLLLRALVWPALQFRAFRYAIRPHDLVVEQGVIFRQTICVPRDRIQHVDTRQGWIERALALSRLLVYTGAGLSADGSLPGLDADEAVRLRDELARGARGLDDGV